MDPTGCSYVFIPFYTYVIRIKKKKSGIPKGTRRLNKENVEERKGKRGNNIIIFQFKKKIRWTIASLINYVLPLQKKDIKCTAFKLCVFCLQKK